MDDLATEVVRLAIQAAGPIGGHDAAWLQRIQETVPQIAALLRPAPEGRENDPMIQAVNARKVLEAAMFKAEYVDHSLEESSQRIVARFRSETANAKDQESDGTEHIRTEPMWSPAGRLMRSKLDQLEPGQAVMVYKHMEQISASKNVRVLVHLVPGRKPDRQVERVTTSDTPSEPAPDRQRVGSAARPPATADPTADTNEQHGPHYETVQKRLEALTARQRVAWAALCRGKGVMRFNDPDDEDIDKVLLAFSELEKGQTP